MTETFERMLEKRNKPDYVKVLKNKKCRHIELVVSASLKKKHYEILDYFINNHIINPRLGHVIEDWEEDGNYYFLSFLLNEEVVDEYMKRMGIENEETEDGQV